MLRGWPPDAVIRCRRTQPPLMNPAQIFSVVLLVLLYAIGVYLADRALEGRAGARGVLRWVAVAAPLVVALLTMQRMLSGRGLFGIRFPADYARVIDWTKLTLAMLAAVAVFYESHRAGNRRPIAARWKKFVGVTLGLAAICAYFSGFPFAKAAFGYSQYYHRWDQFHYYMGAKYFRELGYDGLYKCSAVAQDELGTVTWEGGPRPVRVDLSKEVHHPDKKIRNLGGDNLLIPVTPFLEHPEQCRTRFAPVRWAAFKEDVKFFRFSSDKSYWEDMQKDHGYNPPPVWTVGGWVFASMFPAGHAFQLPILGKVIWLQALAMLDVGYLAAMFAALWWGFGWRVFAVGAVFWGTQASAPFYWTGGAFLRQDWLFFLVLAAALVRKRCPRLAGAALVYAGLLRIFPGLAVIGWLTVAGYYVWDHRHSPAGRHRPLVIALAAATVLAAAAIHFTAGRPLYTALGAVLVGAACAGFYAVVAPRMHLMHQKVLVGGIAAAAVLIPLSRAVAGTDSYTQFFRHTLEVHDHTPLTNHMGLRVLIAQKAGCIADLPAGWCTGPQSGRMKFTKDGKLADPFEVWKRMREERYAKYRFVAYAIIAASFAAFALALRRTRSLWIAQCLGQIWVILLSQLTCYYYSFLILTAPLTKARREIEAPLFGLAALSQIIGMNMYWNDDKYTALTFVSLLFCYALVGMFMRKTDLAKLRGLLSPRRAESPATPPSHTL